MDDLNQTNETEKNDKKIFYEIVPEYFKGVIIFGVVLIFLSMWLYNYHYLPFKDAVLGLVSAASLFLGTIVLGEGIRLFKDSEHFNSLYVRVKNKKGVDIHIKKRFHKRR